MVTGAVSELDLAGGNVAYGTGRFDSAYGGASEMGGSACESDLAGEEWVGKTGEAGPDEESPEY